jgi:hypothetical protein
VAKLRGVLTWLAQNSSDDVSPGAVVAILLFGLVGLAVFALEIWAFIDVIKRPDWAFQAAGTSKTTWILLLVLGFFLCGPVSLVAAIIWLASKRAQVDAAERGAPPGYRSVAPDAPPPAPWQPPDAPRT